MLKEIINDHIHPHLKRLGFKKSGLTWNKSFNGVVQVINLQLSRFNDNTRENFTINLGVCYQEIWKSCWLKNVSKIIHESDCFPRRRIGELMYVQEQENFDLWWTCTSETDNVGLGLEIVSVISLKCIPFLDFMVEIHNVTDYYKQRSKNLPLIEKIYLSIMESRLGNHEAAKNLLNEVSAVSSSWAEKANQVRSQLF